MARRSKHVRLESISGGYGAIPWVVMDSVSFKGATDKAKALLFALMRQHAGNNNGHLHLARNWLYQKGWTCQENNRKSRNELIERGLIVQTIWGGLNMGADRFALTWYDITNYVGLDITAKGYSRGAFILCNLEPTKRRNPPVRKQIALTNDRASTEPTIVTVSAFTGPTIAPKKVLLDQFGGTTTGHNVFIPLPHANYFKGIDGEEVGVVVQNSKLTL